MAKRTPTPAPGIFDQFEELHTALEKLHRISRLYGMSVRLWSVGPSNERLELARDDLATLFDTLAEVAGHELARSTALHNDVRSLLKGV